MISNFFNNIIVQYCLRILLSFSCGFCLGLERKIRRHAVGIRTLVLISVSSTLLSILSVYMAETPMVAGDPTRIAAGVITGIGFLGGGAILRQGLNIRGLTTAAIIFTAAAIGLTCGAGLFIPAIITLAIALLSLYLMDKLERRFFPAEKTKSLHLKFANGDIEEKNIHSLLQEFGLIILDVNVSYSVSNSSIEFTYLLKTPDDLNFIKLAQKLSTINKLEDFSICDK